MLVVVLLLLLVSMQVHAVVIRADQADADYLDLGAEFESAVAWVDDLRTCGATIVYADAGIGWAVTSAHCVTANDGVLRRGSSAGAGYDAQYGVVNVQVHPDYDGAADHDLAILQFTGADAFLPVTPIYTGYDQIGQTATIVGFGATGAGSASGGDTKKRGATNVVDAAGPGLNTLHLDFDDPTDVTASSFGAALPEPLEGIGCFGDDGGGLFADFGSGQQLMGVLSSVSSASCDYGSTATYTNLAENLDFINFAIAGGPGREFFTRPAVRVPEPGTLALLGAGLIGMGFARRRKKA